uniref:Uncharacterized protein n=1 Tax=Sus scrofa TaxID=9823 RepID=A0A8D0SW65_PIG
SFKIWRGKMKLDGTRTGRCWRMWSSLQNFLTYVVLLGVAPFILKKLDCI